MVAFDGLREIVGEGSVLARIQVDPVHLDSLADVEAIGVRYRRVEESTA